MSRDTMDAFQVLGLDASDGRLDASYCATTRQMVALIQHDTLVAGDNPVNASDGELDASSSKLTRSAHGKR